MLKKTVVGILDYGAGNLKSVEAALEKIGARPVRSSDVYELDKVDKLIIPGVGAFPHAIEVLKSLKMDEFIHSFAKSGRTCLGICLGMQLLTTSSTEFELKEGLDLIPGTIERLSVLADDTSLRLPFVGWSTVNIVDSNQGIVYKLFADISSKDQFYFVHSYGVSSSNKNAKGLSQYEHLTVASVIVNDNIVGVQFHPEKSGKPGLKLLENFINL